MPKISIISPTYNESKNIERLIKEIHEVCKDLDYELIIVDDNSPDETADKAMILAQHYEYPVVVEVRKTERGLSSAVLKGFEIAKGDILGVIDSDLQHPPNKIPELIKALEQADIAIGSRMVEGGGAEGWPVKRKLTSWGATLLSKPLTNVKDPMAGYFFLKKEVIKDAPLVPRGYKILLEILVKGKYNKVKEIPILFRDRTEGASKLTMFVNMQYVRQLLHLYWWKIKN